MGAKRKFLEELRGSLQKYPSNEVDDLVEYYDELISERIANGEKETDVMRQIRSAADIATDFRQENALNKAMARPTPSNGLKALIAVLSVLSLPLTIPVIASVIACFITFMAVIVSISVALVGMIAVAIFAVAEATSIVVAGDGPLYLLFIVTGLALIAMFVAFELIRGMVRATRWSIRSVIRRLKKRHTNKKQEEQKI